MVYLHLMRNIFITVYKIPTFCAYFTEEIVTWGVKLISFYLTLFSSGYLELWIIAVELFAISPFDIKKIIKSELRRTSDAEKIFDMIEFALELPDN